MDDDEILIEDYKVVQKRGQAIERAVSNWERTFLLVNGVIFGLFLQILLSDYAFKKNIIGFCSAIGIVVSLIWFLIQGKGYHYSKMIEYRMEKIEDLIRDLKPDIFTFAWFREVKNYKKENKDKLEVKLWKKVSTYWLRTFFPLFITLLWVFLLIMNFCIDF
ncbi:MAG: hypothetical protein ACFFDT_04785 [Candidatus Hodarchaeota archaeon]